MHDRSLEQFRKISTYDKLADRKLVPPDMVDDVKVLVSGAVPGVYESLLKEREVRGRVTNQEWFNVTFLAHYLSGDDDELRDVIKKSGRNSTTTIGARLNTALASLTGALKGSDMESARPELLRAAVGETEVSLDDLDTARVTLGEIRDADRTLNSYMTQMALFLEVVPMPAGIAPATLDQHKQQAAARLRVDIARIDKARRTDQMNLLNVMTGASLDTSLSLPEFIKQNTILATEEQREARKAGIVSDVSHGLRQLYLPGSIRS